MFVPHSFTQMLVDSALSVRIAQREQATLPCPFFVRRTNENGRPMGLPFDWGVQCYWICCMPASNQPLLPSLRFARFQIS